jgi:hypothetical protein
MKERAKTKEASGNVRILKVGDIVTPNERYEDGSPPLVNRKEKWFSGYGGRHLGHFGKIVGNGYDSGNSAIPEIACPCEYVVVEDLITKEKWNISPLLLCLVSDKLKQMSEERAKRILTQKPWWRFW